MYFVKHVRKYLKCSSDIPSNKLLLQNIEIKILPSLNINGFTNDGQNNMLRMKLYVKPNET